MYAIGRWMQRIALAVLPLAMILQLENRLSLAQMLLMVGFGVALFGLGYQISSVASKP
jgi:hypothetical protein